MVNLANERTRYGIAPSRGTVIDNDQLNSIASSLIRHATEACAKMLRSNIPDRNYHRDDGMTAIYRRSGAQSQNRGEILDACNS